MPIDIVEVCSLAEANLGDQTLAITFSVLFSAYTIVSIALSALTIYTASNAPPPEPKRPQASPSLYFG